jgi:antitoxin (DNA-binding transcriptional repressor) of toxin-antitoxin stability system
MAAFNMLQAKTHLSRLVESIEQGTAREIVNARGGKPAAKLVPLHSRIKGQRLGAAKACFEVPDDIDQRNADVAQHFGTQLCR